MNEEIENIAREINVNLLKKKVVMDGDGTAQLGRLKMNAAIVQLEISLEVLETNEPINRANGNIEQAECEVINASEIRQALAILRTAAQPSLEEGK